MTSKEHQTFSQHDSFVCRKLCLNRLGRDIFSAFPEISLRSSEASKTPKICTIATSRFGKSVLHTCKLLSSDKRIGKKKDNQLEDHWKYNAEIKCNIFITPPHPTPPSSTTSSLSLMTYWGSDRIQQQAKHFYPSTM